MYLTDADLLSFLQRAAQNLKTKNDKQGLIFVKENVHETKVLVDRVDNSIMRTEAHFEHLFREAGLVVVSKKQQENLPDELHNVSCFVLAAATAAMSE